MRGNRAPEQVFVQRNQCREPGHVVGQAGQAFHQVFRCDAVQPEVAVGASVRIGQHAAGSGREDEFRFRSVEQALQGIRGVPVAESEQLQRLVPRQTASERIALHDAEPVFMPGHVDRRHSFFVDPYPAPCGEVFVASAVQNGDQVVPCGIAVTVVGQILADAVAEFFRPQFGEKHLHDHRGFAVNDLAVQQSRIGKVR